MNTQEIIIHSDMDGVLADFESALEQQTPETLKEYEGRCDEIPGLFELMSPMPGAIETLLWLHSHFNVFILSTAPSRNPGAWTHKKEWVDKHFPTFQKRLTLTHHKEMVKGHFLIDDRTANGAGEFEGMHIHFGKPGFETWKEVKQYFMVRYNISED